MPAETHVVDAEVSGPSRMLRLVVIVATVGWEVVRTGPSVGVLRLTRGRPAARARLYRAVVRLLQHLGPTFVKVGQIASTRRDTMPPELCDRMAQLHDRVTPMTWPQARAALDRAVAARPELAVAEIDETPVGSGSIACVHRARLADGRIVALKLKRPDVDRRIRTDLSLIRGFVRLGERLPSMRGMPMADLVGYVSRAVLGQLDFAREATNLELLRSSVAELPEIRVPVLYPDLSGPDCLVFEFVEGLDPATPAGLSAAARARLGAAVLAAAHRMMFVRGVVHCDLHPGNIYLTRDERVVILDAGYCVRLPDRVRDLMGEFFARLAVGDGRRCGEIVLESAVVVAPHTDREAFVADLAALVVRSAGPGKDFVMSTFGNEVFALQQRHGIFAASDFAFPLMSLLVLEGTVRGMWPEMDFQRVGQGSPESADAEVAPS
ncbi:MULTISPECIES: ABC1 kinase family protein [Micromonospora]|uniref:Ubiquinone biosynthesis protein n=1 Tax=Micromonospora yangpuensis TaxID=683228 RepID=A0A1C6UU92_9ACTN|nr:AarF/UbiB family protein [Micromonospora yangpuensis]GGM24309.1 hypothetical protein GCM10012279_48320 [Micromonospora yangpuensis]SCL57580.1 ubiquinone biosynthesis protein [Micromonospora yangpuensis]